MMKDGVYIESACELVCSSAHPASDLKQELERLSNQKFRRINRYILLALCGVFRLPSIGAVPPSSGLYIGTKNGCITETVSMLGQIYRDSLLPMPFTFIASSSNMASYHIASALRLHGGNYTLSHASAPFETAFASAYRDIVAGKCDTALAGCTDEAALPLEAFKESVGMEAVRDPQEGGYWVHLTTRPRAPIAEVVQYVLCTTKQEAQALIPQGTVTFWDDAFGGDAPRDYVGSNAALGFVRSLVAPEEQNVALVSRVGSRRMSLLIIKTLRK